MLWARNVAFRTLPLLLWGVVACSDAAPPGTASGTDPSGEGDDSGGDEPSPPRAVDASTRRDASSPTGTGIKSDGGTKPGSTALTGDASTKDSGTSGPAPIANDAAVADGGGSPAATDSGTPDPVDIPAPMAAPLVWGFGIGITDVPAASKFYTEVMKMTVAKDSVKRFDSTDTILEGAMGKRGARLLLMNFDDKRNTRKITAKLVFQASNSGAVNTAASKYPDYVSRLNFGVVQFDGPETYIHEVGGSFDSGGSGITVPYPIAMGFATSDLAASRKFYIALGMTESRLGSFSVTDINGTATITEYTLKFAEGMGVVLQEWSTKRNAKDNPIKVIMFVPDAKAIADKVVAAGGSVVKEAERLPAYDNRLVITAKDLDGYLLDLVQ
ncbi:MAG: hypothetical protein RLZZ450_611 [Pseudomonadota bacterium]|jgi:predicted enzyme related to lactoylglutathione lyase